jgi:hypothetical protein
MDDDGNPMDEEMQLLNKASRKQGDREYIYKEWDKGTTTRIKSVQSIKVRQRDRPDPVQVRFKLFLEFTDWILVDEPS